MYLQKASDVLALKQGTRNKVIRLSLLDRLFKSEVDSCKEVLDLVDSSSDPSSHLVTKLLAVLQA